MTTTTVATQRLTYPISPEYVRNWTAERALAELVANAIDEDPSGFSLSWADGTLTIEDGGAGIPEEGLVLGYSSKSDAQIGTWGEGKKLSLLILARNPKIGHVRVETVGYGIVPTITRGTLVPGLNARRLSSKAPQLLAYDFFACDRTRGTRITIECDEGLYEKVRERFLQTSGNYQPPPAPGRVLKGMPGGKIFIGGVLVSDKRKLTYSYDFALADAKHLQNRDRSILDQRDVTRLVHRIMGQTTDAEILEGWARAALDGTIGESERHFPSKATLTPAQRKAWAQAAQAIVAGRKLVYTGWRSDHEALLDLQDRGYERVEAKIDQYQHGRLMELLGIPEVGAVARQRASKPVKNVTKWVAESKLTDAERTILQQAHAVVTGIFGAAAVDKLGVYASVGEDDGERVSELAFGGFYAPRSGRIGLHRDNLASLQKTVEVLVHEAAHRLAHRESKWDFADRTRGFERQLGDMAAKAALLLHQHGLTEQLAAAAAQQAQAEQAAVDQAQAACVQARTTALVRQAMQSKGYRSAKALAEASFVSAAVARRACGQGGWSNPDELHVLGDHLGLPWPVLFFCLNGSERALEYGHSRRKSGRLYGRIGEWGDAAVAVMALLGPEWAADAKVCAQFVSGALQPEPRCCRPADTAAWQACLQRMIARLEQAQAGAKSA